MTRTGFLVHPIVEALGQQTGLTAIHPRNETLHRSPRNHQGNHSTLSVFTQPGSEAAIHLPPANDHSWRDLARRVTMNNSGGGGLTLPNTENCSSPSKLRAEFLVHRVPDPGLELAFRLRRSPVDTLLGTSQASSTSTMALRWAI